MPDHETTVNTHMHVTADFKQCGWLVLISWYKVLYVLCCGRCCFAAYGQLILVSRNNARILQQLNNV